MIRASGRTVSSRSVRRAAAIGPLVVGTALVLTACSGGHKTATVSGRSSPQGSTVGTVSPARAIVDIRDLPGHPHALTTASGFALYTYSSDPTDRSVCTGSCATFWPPLLLPTGTTTPVGGPGVSGLGTISRAEGVQVTFQGHPLYTFQHDAKAGEVTGEGAVVAGGTFKVAVESAEAVAAASTTSTSSAGPGAGPNGTSPSTGRSTAPTSSNGGTVATTSPTVRTTMVTAPHSTTTSPRTTVPPGTAPPSTAPPSTSPPTTSPPTSSTTSPSTLPVY
jgi:predicted lipoprotein with Yx(FWY)xxD motif